MIKDVAEVKKNVLIILERFPFYKYAASINRISEDTLKAWRDEDVEFSDACEAARSTGIMKIGGRATPEFLLKNAEPSVFKDKKEVENFNFEVTRRNEDTSQHVRTNEPTPETTGSVG